MEGSELRARREAAGMTRAELAAAMGLSERTIYRLEAGETSIRRFYLNSIEDALPGKVGAKTPSKRSRNSAA